MRVKKLTGFDLARGIAGGIRGSFEARVCATAAGGSSTAAVSDLARCGEAPIRRELLGGASARRRDGRHESRGGEPQAAERSASSPEDRHRVAIGLREQHLHVHACRHPVVLVEPRVAVTPIRRPQPRAVASVEDPLPISGFAGWCVGQVAAAVVVCPAPARASGVRGESSGSSLAPVSSTTR